MYACQIENYWIYVMLSKEAAVVEAGILGAAMEISVSKITLTINAFLKVL